MSADALATLRGSNLKILEGVGGVRSQNFYWQWGAIQRSEALRERLGNVSISHVPTGDEITQGRFPRARGYQTNVNLLVRDLRSGAEYFTPMGVVSEKPLSVGDALVRAAHNLRRVQTEAHMAGNTDSLQIQILSGGYVTDVIERLPLLPEDD